VRVVTKHATAAAFSLALLFAGAAHATTTAVSAQGGADGSERCLASANGTPTSYGTCSGGTYHGALSLVSVFEKDLGFAPGSFARVDDAFDRLWTNTRNFGQVQARARYASDSSRLGYDAGSGYHNLTAVIDDSDHKLIRVENRWMFWGDPRFGDFVNAADAWINIPLDEGVPFAFVLHDKSADRKYTSNPFTGVGSGGYANSASDFDHMVTFAVPDAQGAHYFIAWEDRNPGDRDYNDLVLEIRYTNPVPEPETYGLLLAGLGLLGFVARRRRSPR
jgi:hypothetical protein